MFRVPDSGYDVYGTRMNAMFFPQVKSPLVLSRKQRENRRCEELNTYCSKIRMQVYSK